LQSRLSRHKNCNSRSDLLGSGWSSIVESCATKKATTTNKGSRPNSAFDVRVCNLFLQFLQFMAEQPTIHTIYPQMVALATPAPQVTAYSGGLTCKSCGFKGQNHVRYIYGRVAKGWMAGLFFLGCCQLLWCCPRIYDNLIVCGNCGIELNRVQPNCCDVC
jgi:hypothetical protein